MSHPFPHRVVSLVAVCAGAAAALVACGGSRGQVEVSHAEFARAAQETCAASARAVSDIAAPDPSDPAAMATAIEQVVALQRDALADLASMPSPTGARDEVDRWLALVAQVLEETDTAVEAWRGGDVQAAGAAVARANERNAAAEDLARRLGVPNCASAPTDVPAGAGNGAAG